MISKIHLILVSYGLKYGHEKDSLQNYNLMGVAKPTRKISLKYQGNHKMLQMDLFLKNRVIEQYNSYLGILKNLVNNEINDNCEDNEIPKIKIGFYGEWGWYRSVAFVELFKDDLDRIYGDDIYVDVIHRDINKKKTERASNCIKKKKI
jgi:RNase adaptor protein for sRNA GlmZ degradation